MENLPDLVLSKIFSYLSLPDKLNCLGLSKSWMNLTAAILNRQTILDITSVSLCSLSSSTSSSSSFSSTQSSALNLPSVPVCPDDSHQPNRTDIVSFRHHCDPRLIVNLAKWCPNLSIIRINDYDCCPGNSGASGGWLGILSTLITNLDRLVCLHLPHFGDSTTVEQCLQLIIATHADSIEHLSINDNISEKTLWLMSKKLVNLQFLALYGQIIQCQGFENWPVLLGPKFSGLHLDLGFDDNSNWKILSALFAKKSICENLTHLLLTTTSTDLFLIICSKLSNLQQLTVYLSDEHFHLPNNHVLTHLNSLSLSICVQENSCGDDVGLVNFLSSIKNLKCLSLTNFYVRRHFFENLSTLAPQLQRILLNDEFSRRRKPLSGDELLKLISLKHLSYLVMEISEIDIRQHHVLGLLNGLKGTLEHLKLAQCKNLNLEEEFIQKIYDLTLPSSDCIAKSLDITAELRDKSIETSQQTNIQYSSFGIRLLLKER